MNRRMISKQVNQKSCGNFAEHRVIVWFLDNKLEYIPAFFAADGYEPESTHYNNVTAVDWYGHTEKR